MRKLFLFCLFNICCVISWADGPENITDCELYNIKLYGPVKSLVEKKKTDMGDNYTTEQGIDVRTIQNIKCTFDENTKLTKCIHKYNVVMKGDAYVSSTYGYYTPVTSPNFKTTSNYMFEYAEGKLSKLTTKLNGEIYAIDAFVYDDNGHISQRYELKPFDSKQYFVSYRNVYQCNVNGNILSVTRFKKEEENPSYVSTYKYDDNGCLIEEQQTHYSANDTSNYVRHYERDSLCRYLPTSKGYYVYNDNGDVVEHVIKYENKEKTEKTHSDVIRNDYVYDSYGNWIRRNIYKNGKLMEASKRKIKYYKTK